MTADCVYEIKEFPFATFVGYMTLEERKVVAGFKHTFVNIPTIGQKVTITMNNLGQGVVDSFFIEHGYVGVIVKLDSETQPIWHKKQNKGSRFEGKALVFGAEVK